MIACSGQTPDRPWPGTLRETLQAVAAPATEQQSGDPVLAAALDHEEQRLPIQLLLRQFDAHRGAGPPGDLEQRIVSALLGDLTV